MATVRAKFKCNEINRQVWNKGGSVVLNPVTPSDANPENKTFWEASPSGKLEMCINNPAGFQAFELGKEYYIDFTPVS